MGTAASIPLEGSPQKSAALKYDASDENGVHHRSENADASATDLHQDSGISHFLLPTFASKMMKRSRHKSPKRHGSNSTSKSKFSLKKKSSSKKAKEVHEEKETPSPDILSHNSLDKSAPLVLAVQTIPECSLCNMTFSSLARYNNHVKYSSLHKKMLDKDVKAEVESLQSPISRVTQFVPEQWAMLFKGNKLFWQKQKNFDIVMWMNTAANLVLVFVYDLGSDKESEKIFLNLDKLKQAIDEESIKKSVLDGIKVHSAYIRQNVDEKKKIEEAVADAMVSFIVASLKMVSKQDVEDHIVFAPSSRSSEIICDQPQDLKIPEIRQLKRHQRKSVEENQKEFKGAAKEASMQATIAALHNQSINQKLDRAQKACDMLQEKEKYYQQEVELELLRMENVNTEAEIASLKKKLRLQKKKLSTAVDKTSEELAHATEQALQLLNNITKNDIALCKSINKPKPLLADLMSLLLLMLGESDTSWHTAQIVLAGTQKTTFLETVRDMKLSRLSPRKFNAVQQYIGAHPNLFDRSALQGISPLADALGSVMLAKYQMRQGCKSEIEETIANLESKLAALQKGQSELQCTLKKASFRRVRQHSDTGIPHSQGKAALIQPAPSLKNAVNGIIFLLRGNKVLNASSTIYSRRNSIP